MPRFYDSVNGIETYLTDLAGINRLARDRRDAYARGESLSDFFVLGRWALDQCANFSPLIEYCGSEIPANFFKDPEFPCPKVMTREQMHLVMRGGSWCSTSRWPFPPEYATCSECGKHWTLDNCYDIEVSQHHDEEPLEAFVGQPYESVKVIDRLEGKTKYFFTRDMVINVNYVHKEGERVTKMNDGRPWHDVDKDYVIQPGDIASLQVLAYTHKQCTLLRKAREHRQQFEEIFTNAGYPRVNLIEIPNEYWPKEREYAVPPWFLAQVAQEPVIKIGWRKSVINIDWSAAKKDLLGLFDAEDVTKGADYIHAHGVKKASEYLAKILPAITP